MEPYSHIRSLAAGGALPHAWLIFGPPKEREALAAFLAAALLCGGAGEKPCGSCSHCRKLGKGIHPDLITLRRLPDKREMTVEQVRSLHKEAWVLPNEAARKVFLLPEADTMNVSGQNALLKLLEEPPAGAAFLLLGENPGSFLSTVRSRCLRLNALPEDPGREREAQQADSLAEAFIRRDRLAFLRLAFRAEKLEREPFDRLLEAMLASAADLARTRPPEERERAFQLWSCVEKLRQMRRVYVSPGHCMGYLVSQMGTGAAGTGE